MKHAQHALGTVLKTHPAKAVLAFALAAALSMAAASVAYAATPMPNYTWYTDGVGSQEHPYVISDARDWVGFANLVNGTADVDGDAATPLVQDSFGGKYVELSATLRFSGADLEPAGGGAYGKTFDGHFDGKGYTIRAYSIAVLLEGGSAQGATEYIGLFGRTGESASIANLTVSDADVSVKIVAQGEGDASTVKQQAIRYVGALVGKAGGPISNCTADNCTVTVRSEALQTPEMTLPVQWVGGMAGAVEGNLTGCSSSSSIFVTQPTAPHADLDQATIVFGVGGIAGCVGSPDSSVDEDTARIQADIDGCYFSGELNIQTPAENGIDRFGNQIYALACTAGGIAGYTRGNVTNCTNGGMLIGPHTTALGGIVGSLRGQFDGSNFADEGSDDGMVDDAPALTISNCFNTGSIHSWANGAGIVGRTGTNTLVTGCFNGLTPSGAVVTNYVLGGRSTKPFPAGIASSVYGAVSYCANYGEVASIANTQPVDLAAGTYTTGGGYYASGITGILQYYTDANGERIQDMPEIYGCYNAGPIRANALMRQRALVGDNEGYVHDCLAVSGLVENDDMFFVESDNGVDANCYVVKAATLKGNTPFAINDNGTPDDESDDIMAYPLVILNTHADVDGWQDYWTSSQNALNNGYPVVDDQVTWGRADIANAQVSLAANAEYSGLASVPKANVTLNGITLIQNVDYRVIPQADAVDLTYGETPYTANVVGIGAYSGTAQPFSYGMGKGNIANCMVLVDPTPFNWEGQLPDAEDIHVTNPAGGIVDPSEYTFYIDPSDNKLTDGQAVDAGMYTLVIAAKDTSDRFYGQVTGIFTITKIKIVGGGDGNDDTENANVAAIEYLGERVPWQSTGSSAATPVDEENLWEVEYTGHSIKPSISEITYLGRPLVEGRDFRVVYGAATMDGDIDETPNTELGDGWIIVRFVTGSNFTNYDLMHFKIVERAGSMDLSKAEVVCPDEVVYEPGDVGYEPVVVTYGGSPLVAGTDYEIAYENNNALGTASYTITGIEPYTGTLTGTFQLVEGEAFTLLYEYDTPEVGSATVVGVEYNGIRDTFDLVIPETTEYEDKTYTVTAVGERACGGAVTQDFLGSAANTSKLKIASVSIPATVTMIDNNAFGSNAVGKEMTQLSSVTFAKDSQLKTIGQQAFANTGLTEIIIPADVTTIGSAAFKDSKNIAKVTFLTKSADYPSMVLTNGSQNSFRNVKNVEAYGYEAAEKVQANVAAMNALSGYTWNWNMLEDDEPEVPAVWGDANGDGNVNSTDALYVLRYSTGRLAADRIDLVASDVNGDSKVNSTDALYILRHSTGRIDHFPVENQ